MVMTQRSDVKQNRKSGNRTEYNEVPFRPEDLGEFKLNQKGLRDIMIYMVQSGDIEGATLRSMAIEVSSRTRFNSNVGAKSKGSSKTKDAERLPAKKTADAAAPQEVKGKGSKSVVVSGFKKLVANLAKTEPNFGSEGDIAKLLENLKETKDIVAFLQNSGVDPVSGSLVEKLRNYSNQKGYTAPDGKIALSDPKELSKATCLEGLDEKELSASRVWFPAFGRRPVKNQVGEDGAKAAAGSK
jgi:hypothetical protein